MTPSLDCIAMVRQFEGFAPEAYPDGLYYSIGYGHHGPEVSVGQRITEAEAAGLLTVDLSQIAGQVERAVRVPLSLAQFDALVSFAYNVGAEALRKSTPLRLLNTGAYRKAAEQFLRWNKVGGQPLEGLTRRRRAERALFLSGMPQ